MFNLLLKVVSDLVVSVILEWNKLDVDMRNFTSINIFKKSLLQFVRPLPDGIFNFHSPKCITYGIRLRLVLSHLQEHKFKHSFQDTLNLFLRLWSWNRNNCLFSSSLPPVLYWTKDPSQQNQKHWYFYINPNKAGLFERIFAGGEVNLTSPPFIFQEELMLYQYNFI